MRRPTFFLAAWSCAGVLGGAGPATLNCCFSPAGKPLLLTCDAGDAILSVPFAVVSTSSVPPWGPSSPRPTCGSDEVPAGAYDFSAVAAKKCVGKRACTLEPADLASGTIAGTGEVQVRWTCRSDANWKHGSASEATLPRLPLSAKGGIIVDALGSRVRLLGINWPTHPRGFVPGLDRKPLPRIARLIAELGFNVVRLTFSVQMVLENAHMDDQLLAANPSLKGRSTLQVFDQVVRALADHGVLVWLDCHILETDWCCSPQDCNGMWFNERFSRQDWMQALGTMARRYAGTPAVVGLGLRNEPRSVCGKGIEPPTTAPGSSSTASPSAGRWHPGGLSTSTSRPLRHASTEPLARRDRRGHTAQPREAVQTGTWTGYSPVCNASFFDSEVPPTGCAEMRWSSGPAHLQWKLAAERAAKAIMEVNENILISVSGLDYSTDLTEAGDDPVGIHRRRLVYEAHEYYWGTYSRAAGFRLGGIIAGDEVERTEDKAKKRCDELGKNCTGVTCWADSTHCTVRSGAELRSSPTSELSFTKKFQTGYKQGLDRAWGYLLQDGVAPVWLSEFGFPQEGIYTESVQAWFANFSQYVLEGGPLGAQGGLDWSYWELSGEQEGGTGREEGQTESFGVLNHCWTGVADARHFEAIRSLMRAPDRSEASALDGKARTREVPPTVMHDAPHTVVAYGCAVLFSTGLGLFAWATAIRRSRSAGELPSSAEGYQLGVPFQAGRA